MNVFKRKVKPTPIKEDPKPQNKPSEDYFYYSLESGELTLLPEPPNTKFGVIWINPEDKNSATLLSDCCKQLNNNGRCIGCHTPFIHYNRYQPSAPHATEIQTVKTWLESNVISRYVEEYVSLMVSTDLFMRIENLQELSHCTASE